MSEIHRPKPTYFQTITIFSLVLFLIGLFLLITVHAGNVSNLIKENLNLIVELENDLADGEIRQLSDQLKSNPMIIPSSVEYVGKEEALQLMEDEMGEAVLLTGTENPFYDIIKMNVRADFQDREKIDRLQASLKENKGVIDVYYYENIYEGIEENLKKISYAALIIGLIFLILTYTLIHNTLNIALYGDKEEIRTMELVGAEWSFIKKPYLKRSLMTAFWSSALAVGLLAITFGYIHLRIYDLSALAQPIWIVITLISIILIAVLFSWVSTQLILKKHLTTDGTN